MDTKAIINTRFGEEVYVQFATFSVETDYSVLPIKDVKKKDGSFV